MCIKLKRGFSAKLSGCCVYSVSLEAGNAITYVRIQGEGLGTAGETIFRSLWTERVRLVPPFKE